MFDASPNAAAQSSKRNAAPGFFRRSGGSAPPLSGWLMAPCSSFNL